MRCVLEHCEFANGGHCALVCPKRLELRLKRQAEAEKIEKCVAMLRRVLDHLETGKRRERDLPVGVYFYNNCYSAVICHNGKSITLGYSKNIDNVIKLRADAEEAKEKGVLDEFVEKLKAERKRAKKAKRMAKNRRAKP